MTAAPVVTPPPTKVHSSPAIITPISPTGQSKQPPTRSSDSKPLPRSLVVDAEALVEAKVSLLPELAPDLALAPELARKEDNGERKTEVRPSGATSMVGGSSVDEVHVTVLQSKSEEIGLTRLPEDKAKVRVCCVRVVYFVLCAVCCVRIVCCVLRVVLCVLCACV